MTQAQRIIAEMYMAGVHIQEIASAAGVTRGSAKVIASRLGLRRARVSAPKLKPVIKVKFVGKDRYERQWGGY